MLTKTGLHAIRAMTVLGKLAEGEYVGANRIAEEIHAPSNYLGKLLQTLAREGLVESQKGVGGGFRLAKSAKQIRLFDVVEPIEHLSRWTQCMLGWKECSDVNPCAMHDRWKQIRGDYLGLLQRTTVADLIKSGEPAKISSA